MNALEQGPPLKDYKAGFGQITHELSGSLLSKVYGLVAVSLAIAAGGGLVGYRLEQVCLLLLVPMEIGLVFAIQSQREREGWNFGLLYAFAFVSGMTLGPLIASYVAAGLGDIVIQAVVVTAVMTAGLSLFATTIKADLSTWGSFLFAALLAFLGVSVVSLIIATPLLDAAISLVGVLIFSLYLIFDVNRIYRTADTMANAVVIALDIYLDIINIFVLLLRILAAFSDD